MEGLRLRAIHRLRRSRPSGAAHVPSSGTYSHNSAHTPAAVGICEFDVLRANEAPRVPSLAIPRIAFPMACRGSAGVAVLMRAIRGESATRTYCFRQVFPMFLLCPSLPRALAHDTLRAAPGIRRCVPRAGLRGRHRHRHPVSIQPACPHTPAHKSACAQHMPVRTGSASPLTWRARRASRLPQVTATHPVPTPSARRWLSFSFLPSPPPLIIPPPIFPETRVVFAAWRSTIFYGGAAAGGSRSEAGAGQQQQ